VFSLAEKLIKIIDLKGINLTAEDMLDIEGIGTAKAALIVAAFEFVRRRIKPEGLKIKFPSDVLPLIRHYGDRKQEHFGVVQSCLSVIRGQLNLLINNYLVKMAICHFY